MLNLRHTTPLVTFWVVCSNLFQHPWATTFNMSLGTATQVPLDAPGVMDTLVEVYETFEKETGRTLEEEPTFRVPQIPNLDTLLPPEDDHNEEVNNESLRTPQRRKVAKEAQAK